MPDYAKNYRLPTRRTSDPHVRDVAAEETMRRNGGGLRMVDINEKMAEVYDAEPTITGCMFCDWQFDGTAAEGRQEAAGHRAEAHPELEHVPSKRARKRPRTAPRRVA